MIRDGVRPPAPWDSTTEVDDPAGFPAASPVWDAEWLADLRDVPADAVWPRLMTPPHPDAVGSYGDDFCGSAGYRSGRPLRWWQRLVAVRLLEHDGAGRLVWDCLLLTLARQLGKSWLLRELFWWRMHQGARFGEPQLVLHTGKDVGVCKEVQRPARLHAKHQANRGVYAVREVNGQEEIELVEDGSRWMVRARTAVYGYSSSVAGVDEAWKVAAEVVDDGVTPTMVEREQPQLLLVSTAHRRATSLMLNRRRLALDCFDRPADADLLIEWSAPRGAAVDDRAGWRAASPHWTPQRERIVAKALEGALRGENTDIDEPDPVEAFRSQWLNIWPAMLVRPGKGEPLLTAVDRWAAARTSDDGAGPAVFGVEDWFGKGAAVAVARTLDDGRVIVAGWEYPRRSDAYAALAVLADRVPGSRLVVGATLAGDPDLADMPVLDVTPATGVKTRAGLSLVRELVDDGRLAWDPDDGDQLDEQLRAARVQPLSTGLALVSGTRADLLRAAAWAVAEITTAQPAPAIL